MRSLVVTAFLGLLTISSACASQAVADKDLSAFMALHWQRVLNVRFPDSRLLLSQIVGSVVVTGRESVIAGRLLGMGDISGSEALAFDPDTQAVVVFYHAPIGYLSMGGWPSVNPDEVFRKTVEVTEAENSHRRLEGEAEVHVTEWIQKPVFDGNTHTITWVLKVKYSGIFISNAVGIKLARYGIERVTFLGQGLDNYAVNEKLGRAITAIQFDPGAQYDDYKRGVDKAVDNGISETMLEQAEYSFVAGALVTALVIIVKAVAGVVLLPIYWLVKVVRNGRKNRNPKPSRINMIGRQP